MDSHLGQIWMELRIERALLRYLIMNECSIFWRIIERRRERIMPNCDFTTKPSAFEPAPLKDLQLSDYGITETEHSKGLLKDGFSDRLGLRLRWRISTVGPIGKNGKLGACWYDDWLRDTPPSRQWLRKGKLLTEEDAGNYYHYWNRINALYEHYKAIARRFEAVQTEFLHLENARNTIINDMAYLTHSSAIHALPWLTRANRNRIVNNIA